MKPLKKDCSQCNCSWTCHVDPMPHPWPDHPERRYIFEAETQQSIHRHVCQLARMLKPENELSIINTRVTLKEAQSMTTDVHGYASECVLYMPGIDDPHKVLAQANRLLLGRFIVTAFEKIYNVSSNSRSGAEFRYVEVKEVTYVERAGPPRSSWIPPLSAEGHWHITFIGGFFSWLHNAMSPAYKDT